jgi:hypothetical protein
VLLSRSEKSTFSASLSFSFGDVEVPLLDFVVVAIIVDSDFVKTIPRLSVITMGRTTGGQQLFSIIFSQQLVPRNKRSVFLLN